MAKKKVQLEPVKIHLNPNSHYARGLRAKGQPVPEYDLITPYATYPSVGLAVVDGPDGTNITHIPTGALALGVRQLPGRGHGIRTIRKMFKVVCEAVVEWSTTHELPPESAYTFGDPEATPKAVRGILWDALAFGVNRVHESRAKGEYR